MSAVVHVRSGAGPRRRAKGPPAPVSPPAHPPARAVPIEIPPDATVDAALAILLRATRDHWAANQAAVMAAGSAEAVHQFRVGLRRFRSALSLFRRYLPEAQRRWANDEAKWILSELGPVRDLDVLLAELLPSVTKPKHRAALRQLRASAAASRAAALTVARQALASARYARFMRRLDTWLAGAGWTAARGPEAKDGSAAPAAAFARRTLNKRVLKVLARGKSLDEMSVAERHEIRIAIKKIRYGIEFFAAILPKKRADGLWNRLKALQDSLGHLNDVAVAEHTVADLLGPPADQTAAERLAVAGAELIGWHRRLEEAARPEAAKRWRDLRKAALF